MFLESNVEEHLDFRPEFGGFGVYGIWDSGLGCSWFGMFGAWGVGVQDVWGFGFGFRV